MNQWLYYIKSLKEKKKEYGNIVTRNVMIIDIMYMQLKRTSANFNIRLDIKALSTFSFSSLIEGIGAQTRVCTDLEVLILLTTIPLRFN